MRVFLICLISILVATTVLPNTDVNAQAVRCSAPMSVSNDIAAFSAFAHMAADRYGRLHMIWSSGVAEGRNEEQLETDTIFYAVWQDGNWTEPVDILTDERLATADAIVITPDDRVLVSWRNYSSLYLSEASLDQARSARNWSTQDMGLGSVADSDLFADDQNNIHLVYSAHVPAQGKGALGYQVALAGAETWSQPIEFLTFDGSRELLTNVQIHVDGEGKLHSVFNRNTAEENWLPTGVYYIASDDSGQTWTSPEEVFLGARAAYPYLSPGAELGRLYMTWLRGVGNIDSKYLRQSDDGMQWTTPQLVFQDLQGLNGAMPIVFDSTGTEYWVMSGDTIGGSTQIHYSRQSNDSGWSTPLSISPDLRDSEFPEALIINGNQLHIVWNEFINDDIYHVVCQLDAPEIIPAATPAPGIAVQLSSSDSPTSATPVVEDVTPDASQSIALTVPVAQTPPPSTRSAVQVILFAVVPSFILVVGVVVWQTRRNRQR